MKKIVAFILLLFISSCSVYKKDGVEVHIVNNSSRTISNIEFTTSESVKSITIDSIEPNQSVKEFLSISKNKSDGAYSLTFERENGWKEKSGGGYYTNGSSLDHWVDFTVEGDTTIVKFDVPNY